MNKITSGCLIVLGTLLLTACGGGGGSSNSSITNPSISVYDAWGEWSGSYSINGGTSNVPVVAVTEQNGDALMFDAQGVVYSLPELDGQAGSVSGATTAYAPIGETFQNGEAQEQFSLSGTVSSSLDSGTVINGTFNGNNETGTFSLTPYDPIGVLISSTDLTPTTCSIGTGAGFCGTWQGYYAGPGAYAVDLTVMTSGGTYTLSGNDALGCTITGSVNFDLPEDQLTNVEGNDLFGVTFTRTGSGCGGSFTGLSFLSSTDFFGLFPGASGDYFYIVATNSTSGFVAEFQIQ